MSPQTHPIHVTSLELAQAAAALDRELDVVGDDSEACSRVSVRLPSDLERLATRIRRGQTT